MRRLMTYACAMISILIVFSCSTKQNDFPVPKGPYFGQKPPGQKAELFAPGILSTGFHDDAGPAFSPDGSEVFFRIWGRPHSIIVRMQCVNGNWKKPEVASFSGQYGDGGVYFSADGQQIFFYSPRPLTNEGEPKDNDIWVAKKENGMWTNAENLGPVVNSELDEYPCSVTQDRTLYFIRRKLDKNRGVIFENFASRLENGSYTEPQKLPHPFNSGLLQSAPTFALDESYAVFMIRNHKDGVGGEDLFVSFHRKDGSWTDPQNLGADINSYTTDWFPSFSPDGKYLFFVSWRYTGEEYSPRHRTFEEMMLLYQSPVYGQGADIYWVSTEAIKKLRPAGAN